jgi:hypothetical protein
MGADSNHNITGAESPESREGAENQKGAADKISPAIEPETAPISQQPTSAKVSHRKKVKSSLLPNDSDFERDPREGESFSDRERDYLRDKPPHHS